MPSSRSIVAKWLVRRVDVAEDRLPFILDSYALLALLEDETGADRVREVLQVCDDGQAHSYMPMINVGEVIYITERERGASEAARALGLIDQLPLTQLPISRPRILEAAHIKASTAISYADAFVVAAATEFDAIILTGDPEFRVVEDRVIVEWLSC